MGKNFTICVGTLGMGIWRSANGGRSLARGKLWKGYQGGRSVFGLAVHPSDPMHLAKHGPIDLIFSRAHKVLPLLIPLVKFPRQNLADYA